MTLSRRKVLQLVASAAALPVVSRVARAQAYPTRPITLVVPFAPGAGTDTVARIIGRWLSPRLGQTVVIENKPGAGTILATQSVVNAPAGAVGRRIHHRRGGGNGAGAGPVLDYGGLAETRRSPARIVARVRTGA